jgi:serine/threonine-protein kinase
MISSLDGAAPQAVIDASSAAAYASGHLLYVRDGTLLAHRFDVRRKRLVGEPRPIARGVNYFANTGGVSFSVSDNGVLVWRPARSAAPLLWYDRAGSITGSVEPQVFQAPRIAPDGKRFAVSVINPNNGGSDIWVYTIETGAVERVTFETRDEKVPVWSPDGRGIYYRTDGQGPPDIAFDTVPRTDSKYVVATPGVQEPRDVSPDGKQIIYVQAAFDSAADLWIAPVDGTGKPRPLVETPFWDVDARFSPDGKWIAYQSDVSGRHEIYLIAAAGDSRPRIVSIGGGSLPRWSGSGRELFYYSAKESIMTVPVPPDGAVNPTAATALFHADLATFEPSSDGTRFLIQPRDDTRVPLRVVSNWLARLGEE